MVSRNPLVLGMQGWISTYFNKVCTTNINLYIKVEEDNFLIVVIYVDLIIFGGDDGVCKKFAEEM